ncbi:MAG TPA: hypothetical protein VHT34_06630 [Clostridia bacterium]|nr:hypothetical protein [Clostridia bacterium]
MDGMNSNRTSRVGAGKYNILLSTIGWISAIISLVIYPPIFGLVGVISGILLSKGGSRTGLPLIMSSVIFMGIGLIFNGVIFNYLRHYIGI